MTLAHWLTACWILRRMPKSTSISPGADTTANLAVSRSIMTPELLTNQIIGSHLLLLGPADRAFFFLSPIRMQMSPFIKFCKASSSDTIAAHPICERGEISDDPPYRQKG